MEVNQHEQVYQEMAERANYFIYIAQERVLSN